MRVGRSTAATTHWCSPAGSIRTTRGTGGSISNFARAGKVTLSRSLHIEPEQNWLLLYVTRNPDAGTTTPTQAIVLIDGKPVTEFDVPVRANWATPAHAIPVEKLHDRQVHLEVRLEAKGDKSFVDWRSLALIDRVPTLAELFEDAPQPPIRFKPKGAAEIVTTDRYAGNACIQVAGPGPAIVAKPTEPKTGDLKPAVQAAMATLTTMNFAIREQPRFGEYRYLHFAYKKHGGAEVAMDLNFELPADGVLLDARPLPRKFRPIRSKPDPKILSRPPADRHRIALGNQAVVEDQNFEPLVDIAQPAIQSQYRYYAGRQAAPQGDERGTLLAEKVARPMDDHHPRSVPGFRRRATHRDHIHLPRWRLRPVGPRLLGPDAARLRKMPPRRATAVSAAAKEIAATGHLSRIRSLRQRSARATLRMRKKWGTLAEALVHPTAGTCPGLRSV